MNLCSGWIHKNPSIRLNLLAGRNILHSDTLKEFVVNEAFVKKLGFKKPAEILGQLANLNGRNYPIVGVVQDFHENSLHALIRPTIIAYLPDMAKDLAVKLPTKGKNLADLGPMLADLQKKLARSVPQRDLYLYFSG